jgi:Domain of unknown function (DUF1707)
MARPGDEMAPGAGGRSRLRAAHADREQVIEVLKAAFVRGRLTKDEFDARVGQVPARAVRRPGQQDLPPRPNKCSTQVTAAARPPGGLGSIPPQ